jgi:hypothetical protein
MPVVLEAPTAAPLPPPSDLGAFLWEELYEALGYHRETDPAQAFALRKSCEAWCSTLQPVYDLVRERSDLPAWAILFDPDRCPAASLPYLAQFVGLVLTPGMTEEQIRTEIREPTGWARGREPAIRLAGARTLRPVGDEALVIVVKPRTPEAGIHYVRTLQAQTPDPARTEAAFRAAVPAWDVLDYEAFDGPTYGDMLANYPTYADRLAALPLYSDVPESTLP